jgi:integrase
VKSLLEAASGTRYGLLFELLVNTGLRRGEALALKWRAHVKEHEGWLKVARARASAYPVAEQVDAERRCPSPYAQTS